MSDIVERLRKWCHAVNAASAQDLMDEAADEIERLRNGAVVTLKKPAAWHFQCDEYESVTLLKEHADAMTKRYNTEPIPLYYAPTLTYAEREAIYRAEERLRTAYVPDDETAATLRSLLERLA
jgi:hypothetical protein